ncbi:hypothetical protein GE09DRAFT_1287368 [Coniochaeta sp. 2T2.1]|nr:hypothetical protein GE09DRAFT_1287368 [Coniochaeta sp. 2T2.1]
MGSNIEDMDQRATAFIESLASNSVGTDLEDKWYCIAACAFTACNEPKYVATIFTVATKDHQSDLNHQTLVLRRIKESLLKTSIIYGIPRLINAFRALVRLVPSPSLWEQPSPSSPTSVSSSTRLAVSVPSTLDPRALSYMRTIFRSDLDPFLGVMDSYWPDLRTLVVTTIYGYYQSDLSILGAVETSMLNIASLMPMDVAEEVGWHLRGLVRNGGTESQARETVGLVRGVMEVTGVVLRNEMPLVEEVVGEERLF